MKQLNKSRKAQFYNLFLVIIAISALVTVYFVIGANKAPFEGLIGTKAFEIALMSQESEKALFLVDSSARFSAWRAAWQMAGKGGISSVYYRGEYLGYNLWKEDKNLNTFGPSDYKEEFLKKAGENLNVYLAPSSQRKEINISKDFLIRYSLAEKNEMIAFDLAIVNTSLIGSARYPLLFQGYSGQEAITPLNRRFFIFPSFNVNFGYDINEYSQLTSSARELLAKCSGVNNTYECISLHKPVNWQIGRCGEEFVPSESEKIFPFCVTSEYRIPFHDSNSANISIKPVQYKFALDFQKSLVSIT